MNQGSFLERYGRLLLIGIAVLLVVAGAAWHLLFYEMRVTVTTSPASATVTIDGVDVTGQKNVKLKPGSHDVKVLLADFVPFDQTIKASSNKYVTMPVALNTMPHLQMISSGNDTALSYDATSNQLYYINHTANDAERVTLTTSQAPTGVVSSLPKPQVLTPSTLTSVDSWIWSPDHQLGLVQHGGNWSLYDFARFNLVDQQQTDWPTGIGSVSWNPTDTTQLAYYFEPGTGEQTLIRTNPLHQTADRLLNFRDSGISTPVVRWVGDGSDIVLQSKEGRLWRFVVYSKALTPITQSENVADALPSPDGKTILVRETSGSLFLIGIDGKNKQALTFQAPLAQVAWQQDSAAFWVVTSASGSLSISKYDTATNTSTAYGLATSETVGAVSGVVITKDQSTLVLTGASGLALVSVVPTQYQAVTLK